MNVDMRWMFAVLLAACLTLVAVPAASSQSIGLLAKNEDSKSQVKKGGAEGRKPAGNDKDQKEEKVCFIDLVDDDSCPKLERTVETCSIKINGKKVRDLQPKEGDCAR